MAPFIKCSGRFRAVANFIRGRPNGRRQAAPTDWSILGDVHLRWGSVAPLRRILFTLVVCRFDPLSRFATAPPTSRWRLSWNVANSFLPWQNLYHGVFRVVGGKVPLPLSSAAANSFFALAKLTSWSILGGGTKMLAGANLTNRDQDIPIRSTN